MAPSGICTHSVILSSHRTHSIRASCVLKLSRTRASAIGEAGGFGYVRTMRGLRSLLGARRAIDVANSWASMAISASQYTVLDGTMRALGVPVGGATPLLVRKSAPSSLLRLLQPVRLPTSPTSKAPTIARQVQALPFFSFQLTELARVCSVSALSPYTA